MRGDDHNELPRKQVNTYLKYSGLAFQMAGIVAFAVFIGQWIDKAMNFSKPIFTMVLVIVFFTGYMYKLYLELNKKEK
jgi:hypothetical protein